MSVNKERVAFVAGMLCMVLLISGVGGSLAAEEPYMEVIRTADHPAGELAAPALEKVYANQSGIALFGGEELAPGAVRTNGQGAEVPTVLTYVDDTGTANYYVSAEAMVELLDIAGGVVYNKELNCVDFGTTIQKGIGLRDVPDGNSVKTETYPYEHFTSYEKWYKEQFSRDDQGKEIVVGVGDRQAESRTVQTSNGSSIVISSWDGITKKGLENFGSEEQEMALQKSNENIQKRRTAGTTPSYGKSYGAYTEIDPAEVDLGTYMGAFLYQESIQAEKISTRLEFAPFAGNCGLLIIENHGEDDILVDLSREKTIGGDYGTESFSGVRVPKGETLKRALRVEDVASMELKNILRLDVESCDPDIPVKIVVSAEQYRSTLS